jgi:hypothetical protein
MSSRMMHIVGLFNKERRLNNETGRREPVGYEYQFRHGWNPSLGTAYSAKLHFRDEHCAYPEISKKLSGMMPTDYVQITWELSKWGAGEARKLCELGLNSRSLPGYKGPDMKFCFGWSRDGHAKAVFALEAVTLQDLGYSTDITSIPKAVKFEKMIGRILAPHLSERTGKVDSYNNHVINATLEGGGKVSIAIRPKSVYNDGIAAFSERGFQLMLGIEDPKPGMGVGFTAETGTNAGVTKGHAVCVPWLKHDAVFYDMKPLIQRQSDFWVGRLRDLHVGKPYLDIQSIINQTGASPAGLALMARKVDEANRRVLHDCKDYESLQQRFLGRSPEKRADETKWIVERAAKMDIDPVFGALFRSFTSPEKQELYDMPLGRIPIWDEAQYRYVCPELTLINPDGYTDPRLSRLRGNVAYTPGMLGKAAMWRQPNGTCNERHVIELVNAGAFQGWGEGNMVYLGADIIEEVCEKLGTMDFDDAVILTTSQEFVDLFEHLRDYQTVPMSDPARQPELPENPYEDEKPSSKQWSHAWFDQRMSMELDNKGVGFIANPLMCSILIENGRESMLDDLADQLAVEVDDNKRADLIRRYTNLQNWEVPVGIRKLGTRYNDFIDLMKTGKEVADVAEVYEAIDAMYIDLAANMAFPWVWTIGGFDGKGRIPDGLQRNHQIVIARTDLCRSLQAAKASIAQVEEILTDLEWTNCISLPAELKAKFPADEEIEGYVSDLRRWIFNQWKEARENGNIQAVDPAGFKAAYQRIEDELNQILANCTLDLKAVWVELASRIYAHKWAMAPRDEKGQLYHMRDRLCWMGMLAHAGLDAIEAAGLSGLREPVYLDAEFRNLAGPRYVGVKAEQGMITLGKDGRYIGVSNVPDGEWTMHHGQILVRPAAPILKAVKHTA